MLPFIIDEILLARNLYFSIRLSGSRMKLLYEGLKIIVWDRSAGELVVGKDIENISILALLQREEGWFLR